MSNSHEVVLKITHTRFPASASSPPVHVNTFVDSTEVASVHTKEALIQLLSSNSVDLSLGNAPYITIMRKSKKNNKYITLENYDDFRALHRSLRVKNHVKLAINDHSPGKSSIFATHAETAAGYGDSLLSRIKEYVDKIEEVTKRITETAESVLAQDSPSAPASGSNTTSSSSATNTASASASASEEAPTVDAPPSYIYSNTTHVQVACDGCSPHDFVPMRGTRYACLVCRDFDLCETCEAKQHIDKSSLGAHSYKHPMAKITVPDSYHRNNDTWGSCPSFASTFSDGNDLYVDIPMENCDSDSRAKLLSYLEGGITPFVENVAGCIENSEKFEQLLELVGQGYESPEDKFEFIKALIVSLDDQNKSASYDSKDESLLDQDDDIFIDTPAYSATPSYAATPEFEIKQEVATPTDVEQTQVEEPLIQLSPPLEELPSTPILTNAVSLTLKSTSANSQFISLSLVNNSDLLIKGGELTFDFSSSGANGSSNRQIIHIHNATDIKPQQSRFYNLGNLYHKFESFDGISVRLNTPEFIMAGEFNLKQASLGIYKSTVAFEDFASPLHVDEAEEANTAADDSENFTDADEVTVSLVIKSNNLSQVIIQNKSAKTLKSSGLKLNFVNHENVTVKTVNINKTYGILPGKSSKFNVALSKTHTMQPFKVYLENDFNAGDCELSPENLTGRLIFSHGDIVREALEKEFPGHDNASSGTEELDVDMELDVSKPSSLSNSSVHSVFPSLPKETLVSEAPPVVKLIDASSDEKMAEGDIDAGLYADYEIISDDDCSCGDYSDYENISPVTSH